jgi:hypothetical protein
MKNLEQSNSSALQTVRDLKQSGETWNAINPESAAEWQLKIVLKQV